MQKPKPSSRQIRAFWDWFARAWVAVLKNSGKSDHDFAGEMDRRIRGLHIGLSWEIGPAAKSGWQLVISPDFSPELLEIAQQIISLAPRIPGWEYRCFRQPKQWNHKFEVTCLTGRRVSFDCSNWKFLMLQHSDGTRELLLFGDGISSLDENTKRNAAVIVLESILGEETVMQRIPVFELLENSDSPFPGKERPLSALAECFALK
jgi:hypothetical protein